MFLYCCMLSNQLHMDDIFSDSMSDEDDNLLTSNQTTLNVSNTNTIPTTASPSPSLSLFSSR